MKEKLQDNVRGDIGLGRVSPRVILWCLPVLFLTLLSATSLEGCPLTQPRGPQVGTATCLQCHNGLSAPDKHEFLKGPHKGISCEDCHGSGFAHVRAGGRGGLFINDFDASPFGATVDLCTRCHASEAAGHAGTVHAGRKAASCNDCHDVHKEGAMPFSTSNFTRLTGPQYNQLCGECHEETLKSHLKSTHAALDVASCGACHDLHKASMFRQSPIDNSTCLQCHASFLLGLGTDAAVDAHTGFFHPVDPAGTGASRCIGCHMVPDGNEQEKEVEEVLHSHAMFPVPPAFSNEAMAAGVVPTPPNSCAGVAGCHDAGAPGHGEPHDLNDRDTNEALQGLYETIGEIP